ncbi:MAG TPA: YqaJ viral recombinase family protein, partial [Actinomycetes bacterium]|nr:YqaJ viral recombinase family protein [Actinomycetes bacterium]
AQTGRRIRRFRAMVCHPIIDWAAASPDAAVVGDRRLVEFKHTSSRSRFADGIPQDVAAQVAWQLGCTGYPVADIAVMTDDSLTVYEQQADGQLFSDLLAVATDFRRRLAEGGPFTRDSARIRRDHPADDGTEITADAEVADAVTALLDIRSRIASMEATEDTLKAAIQARMGDAATMRGPGWHVTWKRTKDREETDWKTVASGLLATLSETDRATVVGHHTTVRAGFRPLRVVIDKETE